MKILLTGASSFTGYWFVRQLVEAGHEVHAIFQNKFEDYQKIRQWRVTSLSKICAMHFGYSFGSSAFLQFIEQESHWDVLCHHAAHVFDYKNPDFDAIGALYQNTLNLEKVLKGIQKKGCHKVIVTGSVFEQDEGIGAEPSRAFSPYGLSKGLTYQVFRYYAEKLHMRLGKFVIPNPFGPYEEPRFTSYLINAWKEGKVPKVATPAYVRDNIHVDLLAKGYVHFTEHLKEETGLEFLHPSGYVESQGAFTQRVSQEMTQRLPFACPFELHEQIDFPEPRIRINSDLLLPSDYQWSEKKAWDQLANYYLNPGN